MGVFEDEVGGQAPPKIQEERLLRDLAAGPSFLPCPRGFLVRGPRAAAAPGSAPRHSPRRRRRSLPAPPPPPRPPLPCQPRRQHSARSRTAARRRPHNTYRSAGGAWTRVCGPRARRAGRGVHGAEGGAGQRAGEARRWGPGGVGPDWWRAGKRGGGAGERKRTCVRRRRNQI